MKSIELNLNNQIRERTNQIECLRNDLESKNNQVCCLIKKKQLNQMNKFFFFLDNNTIRTN